ncbi:MAG: FHA domain-containing protein [Myxococcales bacterium]|nr:MAG: FHA domain-containing protein [Myxococcales bacterium]
MSVRENGCLALEIAGSQRPAVRLPLRTGLFRIGSSPFNDLTLTGDGVARRHAELHLNDGAAILRDVSGQGVIVNGESVAETRLKPGDALRLGSFTLSVTALPAENGVAPVTKRLDASADASFPSLLTWTNDGRTQEIDPCRPLTIGAADTCDVVLKDPYVSRFHCQLVPSSEGVVLVDLKSTNGSWIGDLRVHEVVLPARADFRVGRTSFHFEGRAAEERVELPAVFFGMIGRHPSLLSAQTLMRRAAPQDETVLIVGETGTGKELAARAIHLLSAKAGKPFVAVNCAALAAELVESELFGHEKGAFTGAASARDGAFVAAKDGTLFLDEIGELPPALQAKLLRALDTREIKPVGADRARPHRARVVAATNRDLAQMVKQGTFRQDLFFRLTVLPIHLPPLRERREDVLLLAERFVAEAGVKAAFTRAAQDALMYHYWPGNVRELRNVVATTLCYHPEAAGAGVIDDTHLMLHGPGALLAGAFEASPPAAYDGRTLEDAEATLIREALVHYGGNKLAASKALGISKSTLYEKIRRYRLE